MRGSGGSASEMRLRDRLIETTAQRLKGEMAGSRIGRMRTNVGLAAALAVPMFGLLCATAAAAPTLTISTPAESSVTGSRSVLVAGTTSDPNPDPLTLKVEDTHHDVLASRLVLPEAGAWSTTVELSDGTFVAVAEQTEVLEEATTAVGFSEERTFSVKTKPPALTISSPQINGESVTFGGSAGSEPGDEPAVLVNIYQEGSEGVLQQFVDEPAGDKWQSAALELPAGRYRVEATQSDDVGHSKTVERPFEISTKAPAVALNLVGFTMQDGTPVTASATPRFNAETISGARSVLLEVFAGTAVAGEPVERVAMSPSGELWSAESTTLSTGIYTARAKVEGPHGESGVSSPEIFSVQIPAPITPVVPATPVATVTPGAPSPAVAPVLAATAKLMQPFPIVRIAGTDTSSGARIRLLTVQAPLGTTIAVTCSGGGCKTKAERRVAKASSKSGPAAGAVMLSFARFERSLRAGALLQIRVTQAGEVGKYTSFKIRRNRLPVRTDACLAPGESKPSACPS